MALGVRARVGVGVGAELGLSAAVAVVWFAASTAYPSTVRYVNGSAPATAPPPPLENPALGICRPMISFCHYHRIPYNFTMFPNFMGHFTPHDAQQELELYDVVLQTNCYELAALYLCTVFSPKCGIHGQLVRPCRSLCLETQRRCGVFLDKFHLAPPAYLECDAFRESPDAEVCVGHREVQQAELRARAPEAAASSECVSGHRKANLKAGCGGSCYCLGGQWVCPEGDCGDGAGEEQEGERDAEAAPEPFSLPLRRSKRATTVGADTSDVTAIVYDDRCIPHTRFLQDCNTCLCPTSGIRARASCTVGPCPPPPPPCAPAPAPPPPGAAAGRRQRSSACPPATTLRPCTAAEKAANAADCVPVPLDGERCAPGVTYMDECNVCICSMDGIKAHASCTFKICPK